MLMRLVRYKKDTVQQLLEIITGLGCCLGIIWLTQTTIYIHISFENPSIRSIRFCSQEAKTSVVQHVGSGLIGLMDYER